MELRATGKIDIAAVDDLLARSYPALLKADYPASVIVTALPLISRAQPALVSSGTYYGAFEHGDLIGVGGWTRAAPGGAHGGHRVGHIRHFATDPQRVRQGVGRALINHCLAQARSSGIEEMRCQATFTAVPFYEAAGFELLHEIQVPLRQGIMFPAMQMRRSMG